MKLSIEAGKLSMRKFLTKIDTAFIKISDNDMGNDNWFANLNTPGEVEKYQTDYDH
ncbi:MAG: hypothetical protein U5K69_14465 [Balneolaceae bacterium]|nr:hypothetical protein [Balneolaceae bacterium]